MSTEKLYRHFQQVFEQYYKPLCKYAFSFIKEKEVCEDIVQDIFVKIWETRKDLLMVAGIKFYLYTAVRNNCLNHLYRGQCRPVYSLTNMDIEAALPAEAETGEGELINYKELLEKGIEQLPTKCKEVFLLSRIGNFSNQEVADNLGISIKTVNNQLWKALKFLRIFVKATP
ncbi:RNA polymerase sigma-70 factor [Chitinophaga sp. 22536]|uniref:RNA polymerase sigma-70 factor n=1 Tax=Chitinophaga eiseniae TaxID=634771 RepID=A0A847S8E1_9BACT|nr:MULTISPECIES: RNA polymerase sigma-70 factor [Chitinophaga]MBC9914489.1 RNA polymerase sigma-70 factor [Chitinophaga varians]NLR78061.1 RNA polymerase sigma-70 factor [Chitinophaga eiseniae]HVI44441.1 RNA polymerase sigma-70 factor [Chitinophaga sp.]